MIDKNRIYRTRDGREVRIYATDGSGEWTVHGAIQGKKGQWYPHIWLSNGAHLSYCDHDNDLIEVLRLKRTAWLNIYGSGIVPEAWSSKENADRAAACGRVACIKIELDFEEGEGL